MFANEFLNPIFKQIDNWDSERVKKFDIEDFEGYMEPAKKHEDFTYKVHVHGTLLYFAVGYDNYYKMLRTILDSLIGQSPMKVISYLLFNKFCSYYGILKTTKSNNLFEIRNAPIIVNLYPIDFQRELCFDRKEGK